MMNQFHENQIYSVNYVSNLYEWIKGLILSYIHFLQVANFVKMK